MFKRMVFTLALMALPGLALAGARKIPLYELSSPEETLKQAKKFSFKLEGKPKDYPKRVAIGSFHARYVFKHTELNRGGGTVQSTTVTTLEFDDATYSTITTALYHQLKARLEAEGIEVVPLEDVLNSAAYQGLDASGEQKENNRRAVHVPKGMKNLPVRGSGPAKAGRLAALNQELGTDAVVTAFVNFGICDVEPTKKTGMRSGVYACLRGNLAQSGFDVRFLGGSKGSADKVKPKWTARVYKESSMYEYNKRDKLTYDMALIARYSAANAQKRKGFFGGWDLKSDQEDFVGGASEVYDDALAMAFERWEDKYGKDRKKAGLERTEPKDPFADLTLDAPVAQPSEEAFDESGLDIQGEASCWAGTSTNGDLVMRRTVNAEANTLFEEQVTKLASGPYRSTAVWEVKQGPAAEDGSPGPYQASIRDSAGAWTAVATFSGPDWGNAGYTLEGKLTAAKTPFQSTYQVEGESMTGVSVVKVGKQTTEVKSELKRVDVSACAEALDN